ncbi:MAG TPA: hypothetical protein VF168_01500 [Trueperaceae bacterium]
MAPRKSREVEPVRDLWSLGVLPILLAGGVLGLLGIYWDIAWHVDIGRDTFFTLPHNLVYSSILTVLLVALLGLWFDRRDTRFHLPLGRFRLHPGVLMIVVAAALELAFAPLDDLWHRLFGSDVSLWAPMHLVGLLAMGVANFGGLVSAWIERDLSGDPGRGRLFTLICGAYCALLLGWSILLTAEYEYSVIQFPVVLHPLLLAALPAFALVLAVRLDLGRFAATSTALAFTCLRFLLSGMLMLTASLELAGYSRPMIPLLLLSALAVDLLARRGAPEWLLGVASAAICMPVNWALLAVGEGMVWDADRVALAVVPALLLSALLAQLAGWVARALRGELEPDVRARKSVAPRGA